MQSSGLRTYFDESVLAFILDQKSANFNYNKESNTLVTLYLVVWHFHCLAPKYGCEVLFICCKVLQNLWSDKLINLTLSFYINRTFEVGGQKT